MGVPGEVSFNESSVADEHKAVVETNSDPEVVVIAEGTTEIAANEFKDRQNLKEVRLPKSLERVGKRAFYGCPNLSKVTFGGSEKVLEDEAFANCRSLRKLELPKSVEELGYGSVENYELGATISLDNLRKLGWRNFNISSSLNFYIGPNLQEIGFSSLNCVTKITVDPANTNFKLVDGMLFDAALTRLIYCEKDKEGVVKVPASVTSIDDYAFYNCRNISTISLPQGITTIPAYAFSGCESLKNIILPFKTTKIGRFAFYRCKSLATITIPSSVEKIETFAFGGCQELKIVSVPEKAEYKSAFDATTKVIALSASQAAASQSAAEARTYTSASADNKRSEILNRRLQAKAEEQKREKEKKLSAEEELQTRMRNQFIKKRDAYLDQIREYKEELQSVSAVNIIKKSKLNNAINEIRACMIDLYGKYDNYISDEDIIDIDDI
jgi:hypothetical protein